MKDSATRYRENPERQREATRKWRAKNPERKRQIQRDWRAANAERLKERRRQNYAANAEHNREKQRQWRVRNKDRLNEWRAEWARRNAGTVNAKNARRHAAKLQATPAWANRVEIRAIYEAAALLGPAFHVDHIVPLRSKRVCGLHCEANLRIIPAALNASKHNRHWPDMFEGAEA